MAIQIASRKPYYKSAITTDIYWAIAAYFIENPTVIQESYDIKMSSFDPIVPETLKVNLSPFAENLFDHTIKAPYPTTIVSPVEGEQILLKVDDQSAVSEYIAFDGWLEYPADTLGLSTSKALRPVVLGGYQYITARLETIDNIIWVTDTGRNVVIPNVYLGVEESSVFPVALPALNLTCEDSTVTISGRNASNVAQWTVKYQVVTAYEEVYTIGFINRYGVWEFFDVTGRVIPDIKVDRLSYRQASDGRQKDYNINGYNSYSVNTGWVCEDFREVIEDLLLSKDVVLFQGETDTVLDLNIEDTSMTFKSAKSDKMINYLLKIKASNTIIPTT